MPSIGHRPLKFKPRYVILRELRERNQQRKMLWGIFQKTIGRYLPTKRIDISAGSTTIEMGNLVSSIKMQRFNQLIYELKRDGLIKNSNNNIQITKRGMYWLKRHREHPPLQLPQYETPCERGRHLMIVSYDIPEKSKAFGPWIRKSLRRFALKQLQKSVWIGKAQIPEEFIAALVALQLIKHFEIFIITKSGSLHRKI